MHRLLARACVFVVCLAAGLTASAADDLTGFYIGANIGGVTGGKVGASTTTIFSPTGYFASSSVPAIATSGAQTLNPGGLVAGGQAGFNYQHKSFVFGAETDYGAMNVSDKKSATATYPCCAPTAFTVTQFTGTSWLFTLRPRVGFAKGPVMVYGTGGVALTNYEYTALFTDTFASASEFGRKTSIQTGWAAGAGAEFKVKKHWSLKGEYLRVHFDGATTITSTNLAAFTPPIPFPSNVFTHQVGDLGGLNVFRFGFNYRFGH